MSHSLIGYCIVSLLNRDKLQTWVVSTINILLLLLLLLVRQ